MGLELAHPEKVVGLIEYEEDILGERLVAGKEPLKLLYPDKEVHRIEVIVDVRFLVFQHAFKLPEILGGRDIKIKGHHRIRRSIGPGKTACSNVSRDHSPTFAQQSWLTAFFLRRKLRILCLHAGDHPSHPSAAESARWLFRQVIRVADVVKVLLTRFQR
jgi:hypothetical protein